MTSDPRARRYLLGTLPEGQRAEVEREYFGGAPGLDLISHAEDELIEDYLDARLAPDELEPFEHEYLASPVHRTRVETIRRLTERAGAASGTAATATRWAQPAWLAMAAAAVLLVSAGIWISGRREAPVATPTAATTTATPQPAQPRPPTNRPPAEQPPAASPIIFAVDLSPLAVRGADETPRVVIPGGTDVLDLRLEEEPGTQPVRDATVVIATVSGDEVWRGPATPEAEIVHVRVPAPRLPPDDYIVSVQGASRYFLRIRAR